jgi:hypothetical protein
MGDVIALNHAKGGNAGDYRNHNEKFALRQKVSGHYVGGNVSNGE